MDGPTIMVAPAVQPFQGSRSMPDLLSLQQQSSLTKPPPSISSARSTTTTTNCGSDSSRTLSLKSLPSLPAFDVPSFDFDFGSGADLDLDNHLRFDSKGPRVEVTTDDRPTPAAPTETKPMAEPKADKLSRSKSFRDRPRSWLPSSKSTPNVRGLLRGDSKPPRGDDRVETGASDDGSEKLLSARDRSSSFADFAKRTWSSGSRSPSPKKGKETKTEDPPESSTGRTRSDSNGSVNSPGRFSRRRPISTLVDGEASRPADSPRSTSKAFSRASVYLTTKIKQRPQSVLIEAGASTPAIGVSAPSSSDLSLPDSASSATASALDPTANSDTSNRRLSSQTGASSTTESSNTSTNLTETTQTTVDSMPHPSSRDPLWAAFRKLDSDYAMFTTKTTTSQRMVVARQTLIPFLRNFAEHPSNKDASLLSSEDVDRRATILNKWWNGLLEMLDGSAHKIGATTAMSFASSSTTISAPNPGVNLQPVAGVDRPGLLEAVIHIMMRPEWRLCTNNFRPLAERSPRERVRARANSDLDQEGISLLAESAEHNVRTMFVNNLLTQMSIVVEKMSSRHAPTSLVNFCGKACAYAFFFVPGVADVLVRLWGLTADQLRRVADEFELPRRSKGESEDIVALFPPNLHKLGWSSVKRMADGLRLAAKLPLVAAKIPWHGPWVSRWRGEDTDLFFIFCKYYYILAEEFMPPGLPLVEKARAPAFLLTHAQLLGILDSTIHHRQDQFDSMLGPPPVIDAFHGADAMVTALPRLLPNNLLRGMEENRMIILLKDMLAENSIGGVALTVREAFADAFMAILKAATKKTPTFRQGPVFMLVDFLQEALTVFDGYMGYTDPDVKGQKPGVLVDHVDWNFWLDVCKRILSSSCTMSEIRMLSFLFSTWDILVADPARKEQICIGWLLDEEVFDRFFNNHTPMVRAYFMRLLCWRICRDEGSANPLDTKIFALVSERLKTVWSHYLWLKQQADLGGKLPPSTAPSLPQPGKRFMIIRTEVGTPQTGLLMGFDSFTSSFSGPEVKTDYRGAMSGDSNGSPGNNNKADTSYKKKWTLLGKVLSFTSATTLGATPINSGARRTVDDELEAARRETAASRSTAPPPPPKSGSHANHSSSESDASSTGSSPVYDAVQFVFKFTLNNVPWQPGQSGPGGGIIPALPRERILTRPRLPAPAQARVSSRSASTGRRSESPPPPAAGLPPPERRFSGLPQIGLVAEARNASPLDEGSRPPLDSNGNPIRPSIDTRSASEGSLRGSPVTPVRDNSRLLSEEIGLPAPAKRCDPERQIMQPAEPVGIFRDRAVYTGRALAEWSLVVNECNSFVDRRRDEGVYGLKDVEVPSLGVDGLRRLA